MPAKKRPLSAALKAKLAHEGILNDGLTKKPKLRNCAHCRAVLMASIHPMISNQFVLLDAFPISGAGEFFARLWGHDTWQWHGDNSIALRLSTDIRFRSADDTWVMATHVCGRTHLWRSDPAPWLVRNATPTSGPPPF